MAEIPQALAAALQDRYVLERELGRGGMATVYLAHDLRHDRPVALKVLHPELAQTLGPERFQREIKLAARLQHPHILTVLDSGETAGQLWFTMPFVEGESLRDRLRREKQLPVDEALRIAREAADALDYAHRHGVIHRDIKPENILLTEGHALVADFGIGKALGGASEAQLTETGLTVGTPAYMSPEQAAGDKDLTARSDVYSLGIVLYEMLAGETPFAAPTAQAMIARRFMEVPKPVRELRDSVSEAAAHAVHRALARTAADRYATAAEFAQALQPSVSTPVATPAPARGPAAGLEAPTVAVEPPRYPSSARRRVLRALDAVSVSGSDASAAAHPARPSRRAVAPRLGAAVLALALLAGGAYVALRGRVRVPPVPREQAAVGGAGQSVAVLPFVNIGGRPEEEYFADGMTEELINALGRVEGLRVVGRASAFALKGSTATEGEIGERLHVAAVLTGSVRRSGGRLRVSAQLVSAKDGFQLWSDTYDRAVRDAFTVQDEITGAIVAALRGPLGSGQLARLRGPRTESSEAHDLVLKARFHFNRLTETDLRTSLALYEQALQHDPGYAAAWAGISLVWTWLADDWLPPREAYPRAEAAARRALELDSTLAEAHEELGIVQYVYHWDFASSERAFRCALALNDNRAHAYYSLAELLGMTDGQADTAITLFRRAKQLEPLAPLIPSRLGDLLSDLGRWDEAADEYRQALDLEPSFSWALRGQAATLLARGRGEEALALLRRAPETGVMIGAEIARTEAQLGRAEEARRTAHELEEESRRRYVDPTQIAEIYTALGDRDSAFVWLERAYEVRAARLTWLQSQFRFAPLRADPRFAALARRVGLPQWRRD